MTEHQAEAAGFETDPAGLPWAAASEIVPVGPGSSFELEVAPVAKQVAGATLRMLAYNGSIPGPTLRVEQGSEVNVIVSNRTNMETTVHWHGLRLENRYDGVPHDTQAPIPPGGTYSHRLTFPDAGLFWYHPHMREDYSQELGLYGNVLVDPAEPDYWPPADREIVLTLDDILVEGDHVAAFDPHHATFTAMGRFGNVLLVGGELEQRVDVRAGEVVRLYLTNTANTRVFKVVLPGAEMKLIGGDGGRYEFERRVEDVVIAPSERAIVDVRFPNAGAFGLEHHTPERTYRLATFQVAGPAVDTRASSSFASLRVSDEMRGAHEAADAYVGAKPDKTLALVAEMDFGESEEGGTGTYVCPMHPEVVSAEPGDCPKCGMKLMPAKALYSCPMHPDVISDSPGHCPKCGMKLMATRAVSTSDPASVGHGPGRHHHQEHGEAAEGGIEWEDTMAEVNRASTPENMRWKLVDRESGRANDEIDWVFDAGDQVKIRLVNEMESDHPMHHPFHVHGQRFLVLARDGVPEDNAVWKDTALVRTGEVVDLLLDASNPGLWMAHCHIAEHMESGMMFNFRVRARST